MEHSRFVRLITQFQKHGGFSIPEGELPLWASMWQGKEEEAVAHAIDEFLTRRTDRFVPNPAKLSDWYRQAKDRLDANKPKESTSCASDKIGKIYISAIKRIQSRQGSDIQNMREAWRLCGHSDDSIDQKAERFESGQWMIDLGEAK